MANNTWIYPSGKYRMVCERSGAASTFIEPKVDTVKATLLVGTGGTGTVYTPNTSHVWMSDVVASELTQALVGTTYTWGNGGTGRQVIPATKAWAVSGNEAVFTTSNGGSPGANTIFTWNTLNTGPYIGYLVLFKDTGGLDTANPLLALYELNPTPTNGGNISITFTVSGTSYPLIKMTHSFL